MIEKKAVFGLETFYSVKVSQRTFINIIKALQRPCYLHYIANLCHIHAGEIFEWDFYHFQACPSYSIETLKFQTIQPILRLKIALKKNQHALFIIYLVKNNVFLFYLLASPRPDYSLPL